MACLVYQDINQLKLKDGRDMIQCAGDMIIYVAGFPAIYGCQSLYFQDAIFQKRAEVPAPLASDRLGRVS
ncbi:hypothetical protein [Nitrosospira multiformis]|uniref:hypothetical protein n=1 Tax=Nitrosospira multiformis TaxID=1231 RepID=UPI001160245F|nr:hypothetical protein [Nitrosospira multiformis]